MPPSLARALHIVSGMNANQNKTLATLQSELSAHYSLSVVERLDEVMVHATFTGGKSLEFHHSAGFATIYSNGKMVEHFTSNPRKL